MPIEGFEEQVVVKKWLYICDNCGDQSEESASPCLGGRKGGVWYCPKCRQAMLDWQIAVDREEFLGAIVIDVDFHYYDSREWNGLKIRTRGGKVYELEVEVYGDPPYIGVTELTESEEED